MRERIDRQHADLSIRRQCAVLGLPRSTYYYREALESEENLWLMREMDRQYTAFPFYGSRRWSAHFLYWHRRVVNRKRVRRLMRQLGLEAVYPRKRLSVSEGSHRIYPYLLRDVAVTEPDQVWATDITYVPLRRGYLYLVAVMDWFSRCVLSWELSNSLEAGFCVRALERALAGGRQPGIFNSDQGCQFTSREFTQVLLDRGIRISMDGRGRVFDNIFVERLWRTVKYEEVYPKDYADGREAWTELAKYFMLYNHRRLHESLGYRPPAAVYADGQLGSHRSTGTAG
jgi:putative transposase